MKSNGRRRFLKRSGALLAASALAGFIGRENKAEAKALSARSVKIAQPQPGAGWYVPNRAPLQPVLFQKLPIGAIVPRGWLREQLLIQAEGLNGRMPEVSDYLVYGENGWVTPGSDTGWEEVPYWLRGFGDLGYVLGDQRVIGLAKQWIDGMIASQQPDGWFGPVNLRTSLEGGPDMWPHMPCLEALRSFHEYSGDHRVLTFMTRYFKFQENVAKTNPAQFGKSWAGVRWGNNLESILWLYNRTGDAFLLDLATVIHNHSADYVSGLPTWHNVNIAQGFREPATYGLIAKDPKYLAATERDYGMVMDQYGQFPGGGFAGDENCRPGYGDPRQGFETCGIVELMQSFDILTRITGNPKWADRREELAFNSLPAALDSRQKGTHYITSANSIQLDATPKGADFSNNWAMQAYEPGIHNYRCCPHNYGMGWPYYAESLWMATSDFGLCAALYAASEVRAKVGRAGVSVSIVQETDYPFGDLAVFKLKAARPVAFPLYLRIPEWCDQPTLRVNGKTVAAASRAQSYLIVERTWRSGDEVTLHLPMQTRVKVWETNNNAVSVSHGPLTYSLLIDEQWHQIGGTERWPHYAVTPGSAWNYGLIVDSNRPEQSFDVIKKGQPVAGNPWTHGSTPIELRAKAKKIPQWTADKYQVVNPLQPSPVRSNEPVETVTLIPMGAARLRITAFPQISDSLDAHEWTKKE